MGFNFIAPCNNSIGYGIHATNVARAIWKKEKNIRYYSIEPVNEPVEYPLNQMLTKELVPAFPTVRLGGLGGISAFPGSKRIEYMVFEVDKLPKSWVRSANGVDEFWATSQWGKGVAEDSGITVPIKVVPEGVDVDIFTPDGAHFDFANDDIFRFLAVGKFEPRKGYDILFPAFAEAFGDNPDVELVVKADNPFTNIHTPGQILERIVHTMEGRTFPRIRFVGKLPTEFDLARLYRSCDAFVLPTRGEGWGLPIMEAMSSGLPVITTNWSAQTEYLNTDNSVLLDSGDLVQANDPVFGATLQQGRWANPSEEELVEKMLKVYNDAKLRKTISEKARKDCVEKWTWENSADKFLEAL